MAIIAVLAAASLPSLKDAVVSNMGTNGPLELSGFIDQARQYATANNTYVYCSVAPATDNGNVSELLVSAVASNDGTDIAGNGVSNITIGTAVGNGHEISSPIRLRGFITMAAAVSSAIVPRPGSTIPIDSTGAATMTSIIGKSVPISFWFAPDGSANVKEQSYPTLLEFAVIPAQKQSAANAANWASVIQVSGLTGTVRMYRSN